MSYSALLRNFENIDNTDWTFMTTNNRLYAINNFTTDQFIYDRVDAHSLQIIDMYKNRARYTLPNTPQIILASCPGHLNYL